MGILGATGIALAALNAQCMLSMPSTEGIERTRERELSAAACVWWEDYNICMCTNSVWAFQASNLVCGMD